MNVQEFRDNVNLDSVIKIKNEEFGVDEIVELEAEDKYVFQEVFLDNGNVIICNLEEELFIVANQVNLDIEEPFPKNIEFDLEFFELNNITYATVSDVASGDLFSEGDGENVWNYQSEYDKRIIIISDSDTEERIDLYGEIISTNEMKII